MLHLPRAHATIHDIQLVNAAGWEDNNVTYVFYRRGMHSFNGKSLSTLKRTHQTADVDFMKDVSVP